MEKVTPKNLEERRMALQEILRRLNRVRTTVSQFQELPDEQKREMILTMDRVEQSIRKMGGLKSGTPPSIPPATR